MIDLDLSSQSFRLVGAKQPLSDAARAALLSAGAAEAAAEAPPDILLLAAPLLPDEAMRAAPLLDLLEAEAARMSSGRIVLLLSAAAVVPLRRFPRYSAEMASLAFTIRALAMRRAPELLVNAVAAGLIGTPEQSGDPAMLGHAPLGRAGEASAITDTILFFCDPLNSYCTGQTLAVDGGWSTGYARSF